MFYDVIIGDEVTTYGQKKHPLPNDLWVCGKDLILYRNLILLSLVI